MTSDTITAPRTVRFRAVRGDDAGVWTATSDDRITTEAAPRDGLMARLGEIVPDILESRGGRVGPLTLIVEWQGLRTVDETTLAVA